MKNDTGFEELEAIVPVDKAETLSRRTFVKTAAVGAMSVAALCALVACDGDGKSGKGDGTGGDASLSVESDLGSMTWDEILAAAKGDTFTFCAWGAGGADAMVQKYWEYIADRAKAEYDITIEYVEYGADQQERFITDYASNIPATIDLIYGASTQKLVDADVCWGNDGNNWVMRMPNSKYIDWTAQDAQYDGVILTDGYMSPFMKTTPAIVYAGDKYDASLAWDATRSASDGSVISGLFHNLNELAQWVKKYPGKFTYLDLLGKGDFHGIAFVESMIFELTDDGKGGWKPVYEDEDDDQGRSKKIQAHAEEWNAWATSAEATEENFVTKTAYVWAYLNELEPYLYTGDGGSAYYGADAYDMISRVNAGDIAVSFTTCLSIYPKTQADPSYLPNAQLYLMQTSVGRAGFIQIAKNSKHKATAMVICNLLLEPEANANITAINGNAYCDSLETMSASEQKIFEDMLASFPAGTSPTAEQLQLSAHNVSIGVAYSWLATTWDSQVVKN